MSRHLSSKVLTTQKKRKQIDSWQFRLSNNEALHGRTICLHYSTFQKIMKAWRRLEQFHTENNRNSEKNFVNWEEMNWKIAGDRIYWSSQTHWPPKNKWARRWQSRNTRTRNETFKKLSTAYAHSRSSSPCLQSLINTITED